MKFSLFQNSISKLKQIPLPGKKAQILMSSKSRLKFLNFKIDISLNPKDASVLICVFENIDKDACFVLMQRSKDEGVHSGQICIPGGKKELYDESNWNTSIRETQEELGLEASKMSFIKSLTPVYIPPSNFIVHPFISIYNTEPKFIIDKMEVDKVFNVTIESLLNEYSITEINISNKYMNEINVPAFNFNNNIVWGATAMMLSEFKVLLKSLT